MSCSNLIIILEYVLPDSYYDIFLIHISTMLPVVSSTYDNPLQSITWQILDIILRDVRITPFGKPVVPDEYGSKALLLLSKSASKGFKDPSSLSM